MFQFRRFPTYTYLIQHMLHGHDSMWVSPFRNLRITDYLHLPAAYRSLSRLSSAPSAKAFALRPSSLDHQFAIFRLLLLSLFYSNCQQDLCSLPVETVVSSLEVLLNLVSQLLFSSQGTSWQLALRGGPKWTRTIDLTIISRVL